MYGTSEKILLAMTLIIDSVKQVFSNNNETA